MITIDPRRALKTSRPAFRVVKGYVKGTAAASKAAMRITKKATKS